MLTGMMGSPVLVGSGLGDVPESALGTVYVFTNGVHPDAPRGPFGFHRHFDSAPGDDDYSPLRALNLVTWQDEEEAEVIRPGGGAAIDDGRLTLEQPDVVVNMPFLTWPVGER